MAKVHTYRVLQIYLRKKKLVYLNGKNFVQPGVLEIVVDFIDQDKINLRLLQQNLFARKTSFSLFMRMSVQKFTVLLKKRGFNLKSNFHILFKTYRDKVQM